MNKWFKFFVVVLTIFGLSVVLTPPIYKLLPVFKFEQIFNRLIMVFSVLSAVLFVILPNLKKGSSLLGKGIWREYGFDFSTPWKKLFFCGFLFGAITVAFMVLVEVKFGPASSKSGITFVKVYSWFIRGIINGTIVGIIEEFFFRGFIYQMLNRKLNVPLSIFLASAFYSLVHFLDNGQIFVPSNPTFRDAIRLLFGYLEPFAYRLHDVIFEFIGLFLFGAVLNLAFVRTRTLFLSIGIHAGTVFLIKFQHAFVESGPEIYRPFYGNTPYYDGPFEWLALLILGWMIWQLGRAD